MIYRAVRPLLFLFKPEFIHATVFAILRMVFAIPGTRKIAKKLFVLQDESLIVEVKGLRFPNPIGLAAGFDKDAAAIDELSCFGFGFIEIGTVTPEPQEGNPKPRLFRLTKDKALINRMGFNNQGVKVVAERLQNRRSDIIVGANIGKNKLTPNDEALYDYVKCFLSLADLVDYFTINVSSPNTPGLRQLQEQKYLPEILKGICDLNEKRTDHKVIFLKIAPDLTNEQLKEITDIVNESGIDGVVAANTTISRDNLKSNSRLINKCGEGGLSGSPVASRSTDIIALLSKQLNKDKIIMGVGGIMNAADALDKIEAGASMIQIYTGFIYEGPAVVKKMLKILIKSKLLVKKEVNQAI